MSRMTKLRIWAKVFVSEFKTKPLAFVAAAFIGLSLLLTSISTSIALNSSQEAEKLATQLESEVKTRRSETCDYTIFQAEREDVKLVKIIDRLLPELTPDEMIEVTAIIHEESGKLPPPSSCLANIPDVSEEPGRVPKLDDVEK